MSQSNVPAWTSNPPSAYDIVTAYFPESKPKGDLRLRPCLVTQILQAEETGEIACAVMFGTTTLKIVKRSHLDVIIQNASHMQQCGLRKATRFDLDSVVALPWTPEFFGCWTGFAHPKIGALTECYIRDFAFKMLKRHSV
jgi:hypothetical protein